MPQQSDITNATGGMRDGVILHIWRHVIDIVVS